MATATTALLATWSLSTAAPAGAAVPSDGNDPVGGLVGGVGKVLHDVTHPAPHSGGTSSGGHSSGSHSSGGSTSRSNGHASGSSSSGRSASHSSSSPSHDYASGSAAHVDSRRGSVADVAKGSSKPGSAQADLLALGGKSLIGSKADTAGKDGTATSHGPVPQVPVCDASGGALCLDLLYADSAASQHGTSSASSTHSGVADACVGGDDETGASCSGIHVGAVQNDTSVTSRNGAKDSTSSSDVATTCVMHDGSCVVGGDVLSTSSAAGTAANGKPESKPALADLLVGGLGFDLPKDPTHTRVVKSCDPQAACAVLNRSGADQASGTTPEPGSDSSHGSLDAGALGNALGAGVSDTDTGSSASTTDSGTSPSSPSGKQSGSATGALGDLHVGDQPVLGLSKNHSEGDPDRSAGDAVLLSLLGRDLIASHATSDGATEGHGPVPDNPLCESSGGALCLNPLYADSSATADGHGSQAHTATGIADLCVGGHDPSGKSCDGLDLGVGRGASSTVNDKDTGLTTAGTSTSLVDLCLHGDKTCTLAADALASSASADNRGNKSQSSSIADLGLDGTEAGAPSDPITLSVPTPADGNCQSSTVCVLLNQLGATAAGSTGTSTGATVVQVGGLGGVVGGTLSTGTVTAGGTPGTVPPENPPSVDPPSVVPPGTAPGGSTAVGLTPVATSADTGALPNTGGVRAGILGLGLLLLLVGAGLLAAVVLGVLLVGVAVLRGAPQVEAVGTTSWRPAASASPAPTLVTHPLKVAQGGYVVRVPEGTRSSVKGAVARIRATDDSLLLTITPTPRTPDPALGNARVLKAMEGAYATVRQTSNQRQSVGGRAAVASYGTVTTKQGATLRYVVISVAGAKRGWAISAFTRGDSDASRVLPLVRAVVNGFRPLS